MDITLHKSREERKKSGKDLIELQEAIVILYLHSSNEIIGYYKHCIL
ncbi:MAG: hypothetical protein JWO58_1167 [Chitinophagaceae bacterium]|nr:hypothetical protein [Chitinophagaceae bacterium]